MRTKGALLVLTVIGLIITLVIPAAAQTPPPAGKQTILRFAYSVPAKRVQSLGWEWMGPEFEKRTNGRYKIEYYPSETLFKMSAAYDSVQSGVAQIANVSTGQLEKRLPLSNVALLPTLDFPSTPKARIAAGNAFMALYQKFPQIQEEYKTVKLFGYHQLNPYMLISKKKELYLPEHFKGLKVGGTGSKMQLVSNNGGADVSQVPPDAYMNMDKGVVEAGFVTWTQVGLYKLTEVAKYYYDFSFGGGGFAMMMNLGTWNAMSPEDQKIFMELWPTAYEMGCESDWSDREKGYKAAQEAKVTIKNPTKEETAAWRKAAAPIIESWIAESKKTGAKDPEAVLAEWQKMLDSYKE